MINNILILVSLLYILMLITQNELTLVYYYTTSLIILITFIISINFIFIGVIILNIYVGAITIIWILFIMLINFQEDTKNIFFNSNFFIINIIFIFYICIFIINKINFIIKEKISFIKYIQWKYNNSENLIIIGKSLYSEFFIILLITTCILFISLIGVIVLNKKY